MVKQNFLTKMLLLCALIVGSVSSAWADDTYSRITSINDLEVDAEYIIVSETNKVAMGIISSDKGQGVAVTISGNQISLSSSSTVNVLTLGGNANGYTLLGSRDSKYIGYNSGTKLTSNTSADSDKFKWTITFDGSNASIANVNTDSRLIRGYDNNKDFRAYAETNGSVVQLYKKVTASGPVDPSVTINTQKIAVGTTATISGPTGLTISFESANESIATVSDAGVVTGVSVGTTTITATWEAVSGTYNAGSKNFTVTVANSTVYEKVTSANQLVVGNKYILVATDHNVAMGAPINNKIRDKVGVSINDDKVRIIDEAVTVLTLGGNTDAWTFLASDNSKYLSYSGNSNELYVNDDATDEASEWVVTDDFQLESAFVNGRYIQYNSGSPRFACYTGSQKTAVLFVKVGSNVKTSFSIASACTDDTKYFGTYSNDKAFIVPEDLTVSAVSVSGGKLVVTPYSTGDIVKANTGVMVSSSTAGTKTVVLTNEEGTEKSGNMLKASGDDGISAAQMTGGDKYYRLTMHNGEILGFWWGAENGAAFALGANKAYLAVPNDVAAIGFEFGDDTTGIVNVNRETITNNQYYTLDGRRVAEPTKGLYIVNGRKVIVK